MFSAEERERYSRHFSLDDFGEQGQLKLKRARVLVIGAGGLGCPVLLYLAAAGVGCIGIADDDKVSLSNLQRQVLYTTEDIGQYKAKAATKRLQSLNPHLNFESWTERITETNILSVIKSYDLIIDGSDNFSTRYLLNDACVIQKKPLVYGAIFKYEGQVTVFNLGDGPTYRCLFPQPPANSESLSCVETGVLGVLPGIIGTWQAAEAIKIVTGIGEPLMGRLLSFDLLQNELTSFRFSAVPENKEIKKLGSYEVSCQSASAQIDSATLQQWMQEREIQLIDVREENEYLGFNIGGKNIPISLLENRIHEISTSLPTIVICQSGIRSQKAIEMIKRRSPNIEVFNLEKGLENF